MRHRKKCICLVALVFIAAMAWGAYGYFAGVFDERPLNREEAEAKLQEVVSRLKTRPVGKSDIPTAFHLAKQLERVDNQLAADAYQQFSELFSLSDDAKVRDLAAVMEGSARRLALPGQKLEVLYGRTADGAKFNIDDVQGKVVLIEFWATWCGPCLEELPDLKKAYKKYHALGFEIVGISIDEEQEDLEAFLQARNLPWTVLHEKGGQGMATYYGVERVPTSFLVDRDGTVVSIDASGKGLAEQLSRLLD